MFTAITRNIGFTVCAFLIFSGTLFAEGTLAVEEDTDRSAENYEPRIVDPADPSIEEPVVDEIEFSSIFETDTNDTQLEKLPLVLPVEVIITEGDPVKGTFQIEEDFILSVTNEKSNSISINSFYFSDITSIDIIKWQAIQLSGGMYKFIPSEYRIVCGDIYYYKGNIEFLNTFKVENDSGDTMAYTIFFDKWTLGDSGYFHWDNSKAYSFSYNFNYPLNGVATNISFHNNITLETNTGSFYE